MKPLRVVLNIVLSLALLAAAGDWPSPEDVAQRDEPAPEAD